MQKRLPKDNRGEFKREFIANGRRYTIRTQEEGIGIMRYCKLLNMSSVWGMQADLASQIRAWKQATSALDRALNGKGSFGEFYAVAQNAVDGVNRAGSVNYLYTYWACCLFIIRDGEDMTDFVEADQQAKIDDWNAEGYHEQDFEDLLKKKLAEFSRKSAEPKAPAKAEASQGS